MGETAKPEYIQAMSDFIGDDLSYEEISRKRGWATGTVGVYIKRGLEGMRNPRIAHEKLMREAKNYLRLLFA